MTDRIITCRVRLEPPPPPEDQLEYLIACKLIDAGIPIDLFTRKVRHGCLSYVMNEHDPYTRYYHWHGEDWRV